MQFPGDRPALFSSIDLVSETDALNVIGTSRPVKDELELGAFKPMDMDVRGGVTTDEETELPGVMRSRKGDGWIGRGLPLATHRKGLRRDFVDGAGLCSPGRWRVANRVLPDDHLAKRLQNFFTKGLRACEKSWLTKDNSLDFKKKMCVMAVGRLKESPFPLDLV